MATRELRYAFRVSDSDGVDKTFASVDAAKEKVRFSSDWDFSKGTPSWSLEDSGMRLVITWVFTEAQADDQLTVHNAVKDGTWAINDPVPGESDRGMGEPTIESAQCHYKAWDKVQ
jgi:hypothetical protein